MIYERCHCPGVPSAGALGSPAGPDLPDRLHLHYPYHRPGEAQLCHQVWEPFIHNFRSFIKKMRIICLHDLITYENRCLSVSVNVKLYQHFYPDYDMQHAIWYDIDKPEAKRPKRGQKGKGEFWPLDFHSNLVRHPPPKEITLRWDEFFQMDSKRTNMG